MTDDDEISPQIITISEMDDGEFFLLEFEMSKDNEDSEEVDIFQFVLERETSIWLAKEILERAGELIDYTR
jgi:hypothetical protein